MELLVWALLAAITSWLASGQTPQTCWVSVVETAENATAAAGVAGLPLSTRPAQATEAADGGGLVLLSLQRALVAYSLAQRRVAWRFAWQPLTEVMADGDVFSYPIRQDGACPLALDEAAGLVYLGAGDRVLYALDLSSGRPRWSWRSSQAFESVVAGGGRVLVSTTDYRQVALDGASGQLAWQLQFRRLSSPQTGVFGDVLVRPDQDGAIWGISVTTGKVLWLQPPLRRLPMINFWDDMPHDPDAGLVYVTDDAGYMYALHLRTGRVAWEANVASQLSQKRVINVAAAEGRVFTLTGIDPGVDPAGLTARATAWNASTGEKLWEQLMLVGSCGAGGMRVVPQLGALVLGRTMTWGGAITPIQYSVSDMATGSILWSLPMGGRFCTTPTQYLPGSGLLLLTTVSEDRSSLELTLLPATVGATCPQKAGEEETGLSTPHAASPPLAPEPPRPAVLPGPDYCWRAQLSQLPLADPATDGQLVYGQDNRGMAIGVDVRTGAVAWKSAACGLYSIWPGSPLVAGGVVYMICATSRVLALNATTGRLLWRTRPICLFPYVKPRRTCTARGSYGHPAISLDLGLVYFGGPDRSYYAFNATTGEEVWNYYEGNQLVTYSSSVGLHSAASGAGSGAGSGLLLYAVAGSDAGDTMKLLALNATDGTLVWSRVADGITGDNGPLKFVNDTLAVGTSNGQLQLFSVGLEGGDVLWSMPVTDKPIYGVERDGDTLYFGDDDGWVRAVSISATRVLWEVNTMELPELDGVPIAFNEIEPRPVYSRGRLYVTCRAGLLVLDAATGAVLWAELSQRSLASPLVIERPEGAQVVVGQYLDKLVSISPNCKPTGRGESTLSFISGSPPPPSPLPPPLPPPPQPTPTPPIPVVVSSSPPPMPRLSPVASSWPPPPATRNATTCPVCPSPAAAVNCTSVALPNSNRGSGAKLLRVSLGLSGVSAKALKSDAKAQAALAGAVDRVAGGTGVRVEVESVSSANGGGVGAGGSADVAVVRLRVEVQQQGGSSKRVAAVVAALEASVLEDSSSVRVGGVSSGSGGGSSKLLHVSPMQAALLVAAAAAGGHHEGGQRPAVLLASARVRTLVVVTSD